jgi:nucleoid-associated protein YgaU
MSQQPSLANLREILISRFSLNELRDLCFDLDALDDLEIDYENLPGESKSDKVRELIRYLERRGQISTLIEIGKRQRSDIPWDTVFEEGRETPPAVDKEKVEEARASGKSHAQRARAWLQTLPPAAQATIVVGIVGALITLCGTIIKTVLEVVIPLILAVPSAPTGTPSSTTLVSPSPTITHTATPTIPLTPSSTSTKTPALQAPTWTATLPPPTDVPTVTPTEMPPSPTATATNTATPTNTPTSTPHIHVMQETDTLKAISQFYYGDETFYREICVANRAVLGIDCTEGRVSEGYGQRDKGKELRIPILPEDRKLPIEYWDYSRYQYYLEHEGVRTIIVGAGDTLTLIAVREYGEYQDHLWVEICVVNRGRLNDECEGLRGGEELMIPQLFTPTATPRVIFTPTLAPVPTQTLVPTATSSP